MEPLVSIIIPVFNGEQFLDKTLLSAQQQTYKNREIIIVDDGSTDFSGGIASRYAALDSRVKVVTQKNAGVASARNCGLQHSSGEYVAFLDADDLWHPTKIERQMDVLLAATNSTGRGSIYALHRYIDPQDRITQSGRFWSRAGDFTSHLVTLRTGCGSGILTRRELALAVGGYDTTYREFNASGCEDLDFELKLAAHFPMFVVSEYLIGYRSYHGSMSSDHTKMERALRAVITKHIKLNGLSKPCVGWTLGEFYKYCFFAYLEKRKFASAARAMLGLIWNDPAVAFSTLVFRSPEYVARKISQKIYRAIGGRSAVGPRFYEVSPLELFKLPITTGRWDERVDFDKSPSAR
jgi:glycosyltransferase involved in cell wall biosynthesis